MLVSSSASYRTNQSYGRRSGYFFAIQMYVFFFKDDIFLDYIQDYPVSPFKGEKRVILSTSSWIGGKNPFLGIAYIVVGCICIVCGIVFLIVHLKVRTK